MANSNISTATIYHRLNNADNFYNNIKNTSLSFYSFIGKSDAWDSTLNGTSETFSAPQDKPKQLTSAYNDMIAMKRISTTEVYKVIPRYNWSSGEVYDEWDDEDPYIFGGLSQVDNIVTEILPKKFYVLTDSLSVYKCIKKGTGSSTIKPTQTNTSPTAETDGYIWQYMYSLSGTESFSFLYNSVLPVKTILNNTGTTEETTRYTHQVNAGLSTTGKIWNIKVTNGGSGYTSAPTVVISGRGTGATATAIVSGGVVTRINMVTNGSGYRNVQVSLTGGGGTGATARAIMPMKDGHGTDSELELGAFNVIVVSRFEYNEGAGDFIVGNDFRQVGILQSPLNQGTTTISTASTLRCLSKLNLATHSGFITDGYITGATSGARAFIDFYDSSNNTIWFHQNEKTGFKDFANSEVITGKTETGANAGTGTTTSSAITLPEYEKFSGKIIILTNTTKVLRSITQIEVCPIVIDF